MAGREERVERRLEDFVAEAVPSSLGSAAVAEDDVGSGVPPASEPLSDGVVFSDSI